MAPTLLIDLDGTLLDNHIDVFLNAYFKAIGNHFKSRFNPANFIQNLLNATQKMVTNDDPGQTLEQVFDSAFYPALHVDKEALKPEIDAFYQEVFPTLESLTRPRRKAIELVDRAFEKGYQVAIATNPLFPYTAIKQRLAWAQLPVSDRAFSVVSSYETFHFTKPNPAYFAEILAQMGCPTGPVVMIGDSKSDDITPAMHLGLTTAWLNEDHLAPESTSQRYEGDLDHIFEWFDAIDESSGLPDYTDVTAMLPILKSTPAALNTLGQKTSPDRWYVRPLPGEWSFTEILCHLRDVEREVDLPRLHKLITEVNPFLPGMDTDSWAEERDYFHQKGPAALADFLNCRKGTLSILNQLRPEEWNLPARHAIFGPTRLGELVGFIVTHDRDHLQQAYKTLLTVNRAMH
ncbi:MAG: HAD-IA family hydrolase [Chloroflexi bacterium]|nr:HAD-IA family hydrolase [Chloroflexota bacterium]